MIKFGTGGWRAVIGDDFTKANIQLLAKALCRKMKDENAADKGIVIGYDRRFLAKEAMQWAVASGLLNGRTATTLAPQGSATRAEGAKILTSFTALT